MQNGLELLETLYDKSYQVLQSVIHLPEKEIRRKHIEILASQVMVSLSNLKINMRYEELHPAEFEAFFQSDKQQAENYIHFLVQNLNENIIEAFIFQTELVMRFLYSKLLGQGVAAETNFYRIIATLFEDTENNWQKDESKLIILLWTFRNTIHTGGIYFQKAAGYSINYKGKEYKFEYGIAPEFQEEGHSLTLMSDLLDSLIYMFGTATTQSIPHFDHPSYLALGY